MRKAIILLMCIGAAIVAGTYWYSRSIKIPAIYTIVDVSADSAAKAANEANDEAKTIEAHPLVKGGVETPDELIAVVHKDSALAHFLTMNGFDVTCGLHVEVSSHALWAKTSYRRGDNFAFSKHNVLIPAGTRLLVDCNGNSIKMKCGNLLQPYFSPLIELQPEELPTAFILPYPPDALPVSVDIPSNLFSPTAAGIPIDTIPNTFSGSTGNYFGGIPCCGGSGGSRSPQPVVTPEPSTIMLAISGVLFVVYGWKRRGRKQ